MRGFSIRLLYILLLFSIAGSAGTAHGQAASSADKVQVTPHLSVNTVLPGTTFKAAVVLDIEDSWHINAHEPLQDYFIGTELSLKQHPDLLVVETRYPEPFLDDLGFADEELALYEGQTPIFLEIRASDDVAPGEQVLKGDLVVQACDNEVCLAPSTLEVTITVPIAEPGVAVESLNEDLFAGFEAASAGGSGAAIGGNEIADLFSQSGWLLAFLSIFVIGLALNLTPCVYPMLSVTVALFGNQQEHRPWKAFGRASVYVFGIAAMYSALGVAAAFTGTLFGNLLQHPWMIAGIGVLLFALALSMFGLYELQPPQWMMQRLGAAGGASGHVGLFFSGIGVGVFAAPCIGPPIIALLAFVGAQADPVFGFAAFFVLSLGLGLPYLLMGTFSSLLHKMPKSGVWMVWVKKVFGVVLVGVAFFYLGLAVFPAYAEWALPATLLAGGVYLGFLERSGRDRAGFRNLKWAVGVAAIAGGLFVVNALQQPTLEWEPYSEERLVEAQEAGLPVMIDFYADWCIPCIEMERVTFADDRVMDAGDDFVRLKVDLTQFNSPKAEALREEYNVAGVPTLAFLDESGNEVHDLRVVGFLGPDHFFERMDNVRSSVQQAAFSE